MKWEKEEIDFLKNNYDKMWCADIAKHLGRRKSQVYCKAQSLGLKKPEIFRSIAGKMGQDHPKAIAWRFQKGHVPSNKGKKLSADVLKKIERTQFKPGNKPKNWKPVGSERVNVDGYCEIKVAEPRKWKLKPRVIWEEANGAIPPGYNIQFKDHNPQNCTLENLYMISKSEQMATENSMIAKYPKELQEVMRLKGVVNRKIHKYQKEHGK